MAVRLVIQTAVAMIMFIIVLIPVAVSLKLMKKGDAE